jgi:signal transduction histidine kinase
VAVLTDLPAVAHLQAVAHRHPNLAELGLGVGVGLTVLLVSLSQTGLTDAGLVQALSLGIPFAVYSSWRYRRRRQREELRERRLLEQRLELARELHDAVASQVTVVGIQAAAARRVIETRPVEAAEALERIEVASRTAVADLRRMLLALREGSEISGAIVSVEPGLADLDGLVAGARAAGVAVEVTRSGFGSGSNAEAVGLPRALDQTAYRIIQEALTNAVRHGAPGQASVEIRRNAGQLELRIRNRLRAGARRPEPGFGVRGMLERASLLDGRLTAGPTSDGDWLVETSLPIAPEGNA